MDIIYLKTFLEVVQTGSFTKTAETLCVSQSAVSRRIQFMETQYGCTLVDRSGTPLKPTPEGRLVLEKALKIVEIEKDLDLELSKMGKKPQFSFISTPIFSLVYLPDILRKFMRGHPDLADLKFFTNIPGNIIKELNKGLFDVAVIEHCQSFDLSEFEVTTLPGDEIIFAAAPELGIHTGNIQLEELFAYTLFIRKSGHCSRALLEENLAKSGHSLEEFPKVVVVDNLDTLIDLVIKGDGIAFISNDLIRSYIESGSLVEVRIPGFVHKRRRTLVFPEHPPGCNYIQAFADQILDHFKTA